MNMRHCALRLVAFIGAIALPAAPATAQTTTRVSVSTSGKQSNRDCSGSAVSPDGNVVAFVSVANNLVVGDTNGVDDIFVHDRSAGTTLRVSVDSSGAQADRGSVAPVLSTDGSIVAFESAADDLVAGDVNGVRDVFVHDASTGLTELVSVDSSGVQGDKESFFASISADGMVVAFTSPATNLVAGDTNKLDDVFVRDRSTGTTERISVDSAGIQADRASGFPSISADGRFVAFTSAATNLVAGDTNGVDDIFVHDRVTGTTERVDVDSNGAEANPFCEWTPAGWTCSGSEWPCISADGDTVAFASSSDNLVANDTNANADIFVHVRSSGVTERVSVDSSGNQASWAWGPVRTMDGQLVVFMSSASDLVPDDTNGVDDVFVHDRASGLTLRLNVDSSGEQANGFTYDPWISADGEVVSFSSTAANLIANDTNGFQDVFVHDLKWIDASWTNYGSGFPGTGGVPAFTAQSDPVIDRSLTLDLANSSGAIEPALLFVGYQRAQIHSSWGGDLLLVPSITEILAIPSSGSSFTTTLPYDPALFGFTLDLQVIELDPGAAKGVSFTPGLELVLGH
jgi:WD40 repeat protein